MEAAAILHSGKTVHPTDNYPLWLMDIITNGKDYIGVSIHRKST
jgi:hypothetical protein